MINSFRGVLALVMMGHVLQEITGQCQSSTSGFTGCECNILRACDEHGKPLPGLDKKLTGYSPSGLEQFGSFVQQKQNLAYLCESGAVAILFDCENRTPLYAATVMNKRQLNAGYMRPNIQFKQSSSLKKQDQPKARDYKHSSKVKICVKQKPKPADRFIDRIWYKALNLGKAILPGKRCLTINEKNDKLTTAIHKGHLIAAAYGRGNKARITATFKYTNTVPQFGVINSGLWNRKEQSLVKWGRENCANLEGGTTENVRMHIIVGVIPSTNPKVSDGPRFFGSEGFSEYRGDDYLINVPSVMWTAACCTFQFKDNSGNVNQLTRHTFFAIENDPKAVDNLPRDHVLFFRKYISQHINLFPAQRDCNNNANYIQLY